MNAWEMALKTEFKQNESHGYRRDKLGLGLFQAEVSQCVNEGGADTHSWWEVKLSEDRHGIWNTGA